MVFNLVVVELGKNYSNRHITGIGEQKKRFVEFMLENDRRGGEGFAEGIER